jgi:hypothetical protein
MTATALQGLERKRGIGVGARHGLGGILARERNHVGKFGQ